MRLLLALPYFRNLGVQRRERWLYLADRQVAFVYLDDDTQMLVDHQVRRLVEEEESQIPQFSCLRRRTITKRWVEGGRGGLGSRRDRRGCLCWIHVVRAGSRRRGRARNSLDRREDISKQTPTSLILLAGRLICHPGHWPFPAQQDPRFIVDAYLYAEIDLSVIGKVEL